MFLSNIYSQGVSKTTDHTREYAGINILLVFLKKGYADITAMYFEKLSMPRFNWAVCRTDLSFFMERCTILNGTLVWDLSGTRVKTDCIDIDPDMLYQLEAIDGTGAV